MNKIYQQQQNEITDYMLQVASNIEERKLPLLHKNILKFGTITNTLAKVAELNGVSEFLTKNENK